MTIVKGTTGKGSSGSAMKTHAGSRSEADKAAGLAPAAHKNNDDLMADDDMLCFLTMRVTATFNVLNKKKNIFLDKARGRMRYVICFVKILFFFNI